MFPLRDDNPPLKRPTLVYTLIILNAAIFFGVLLTGNFFSSIMEYGMRPAEVLTGNRTYTLLTSMFLHGGFLHILFNMCYLRIFGDNIEGVLGRSRFLLLYLGAGLVGGFAHAFANPDSMMPTVGASGAVAGVLGAYLILYPHMNVHVGVCARFYVYRFMCSAKVVIGFWFALQMVWALLTWLADVSFGVAYMAHIGGFIAGVVFIIPTWRKRKKERRHDTMHFPSMYETYD
jgi:membrane associated rhomboid family serine protease